MENTTIERGDSVDSGVGMYVPISEKVTLTIDEAAAYSNVGKNKIRELANDPRNRIGLNVGTRILIKRKEFEKLLTEKRYL